MAWHFRTFALLSRQPIRPAAGPPGRFGRSVAGLSSAPAGWRCDARSTRPRARPRRSHG